MHRTTELRNTDRFRNQGVMAAGRRRNPRGPWDETRLVQAIHTPPPPAQRRDELERQILERAGARSLRTATLSFASFFLA